MLSMVILLFFSAGLCFGNSIVTDKEVSALWKELQKTNEKLEETTAKLEATSVKFEATNVKLEETNVKLEETNVKLEVTTSKLEETHAKLEETNAKLEETTSKLEATTAELQMTNAKLQTYADRWDKQYKEKNTLEILRTDNENLKTNMTGLYSESKVERKQKRLLQSEDGLHQVQVDIQNLKSEMATLQTKVGTGQMPKIGFTAVLKKDVVNLGDYQTIIFDLVYTNIGNDYNSNTGVFTCEVPGMYVFYVHTLAEPNKHLETEIVKNGKPFAFTYAYDKEFFSSGSNMAVIDLQQGDTVLVRSHGTAHDHTGSILDYYFSSFSGFLIQT